ncbi:uncharacterized protein [Physeter macrocephalus]|uniref:Uncharacterized protein n=1 Tax=Physeter macrocephalus TaxID=9755 RepID=A0A455B4J3_PHYMC|nr:uncharacterized protein LOC114485977 [Physeter catodon]|eukprot:XP_028343855.1 uncharacterized protein LOC114485977 [Physeter catodon]
MGGRVQGVVFTAAMRVEECSRAVTCLGGPHSPPRWLRAGRAAGWARPVSEGTAGPSSSKTGGGPRPRVPSHGAWWPQLPVVLSPRQTPCCLSFVSQGALDQPASPTLGTGNPPQLRAAPPATCRLWRTSSSFLIHSLDRYSSIARQASAVLCSGGTAGNKAASLALPRPGQCSPSASGCSSHHHTWVQRGPGFPQKLPSHQAPPGPGRALLRLTSTPSHSVLSFHSGDWLLSFVYRTSSVKLRVAGLQPVLLQDKRVENVDLSSVVSGHLDYARQMDVILKAVGIHTKPSWDEKGLLLAPGSPPQEEPRQAAAPSSSDKTTNQDGQTQGPTSPLGDTPKAATSLDPSQAQVPVGLDQSEGASLPAAASLAESPPVCSHGMGPNPLGCPDCASETQGSCPELD